MSEVFVTKDSPLVTYYVTKLMLSTIILKTIKFIQIKLNVFDLAGALILFWDKKIPAEARILQAAALIANG
jgi:hypothetical protein